jgi:hypothetical protein
MQEDEKRPMSAGEPSPGEKNPAAIFAEHLGTGEGAQKLAYVFFLADYDDELAYFLADVGAIIAGAEQVCRSSCGPGVRPRLKPVILSGSRSWQRKATLSVW